MPSLLDQQPDDQQGGDSGIMSGLGRIYRAVTDYMAPQGGKSLLWPEDNPVGTETVQSMGMPQPTTYAGPFGEYINPQTGQLTDRGQDRFAANPFMGFDTGGIGVTGGLLGSIKAYHGSPHSFDAFDMAKIGTGEGNQTYGRGLYFADREGTARYYRDALSGANPDRHDFLRSQLSDLTYDINGMKDLVSDPSIDPGVAKIFADSLAKKNAQRDAILAELNAPSKGSMYEVNIDAEPEQFLNWDKPLSEQSPQIRALFPLDNRGRAMLPNGERGAPSRLRGESLYQSLAEASGGSHADAAETLRKAGVPGVRYLDGTSRSAGEGTHNYVVFDDKLINLVRKYGIAGLIGGGAAGGYAGGQTQQQ